jgi:hypothetical protein
MAILRHQVFAAGSGPMPAALSSEDPWRAEGYERERRGMKSEESSPMRPAIRTRKKWMTQNRIEETAESARANSP